jgi:hypothetical protein
MWREGILRNIFDERSVGRGESAKEGLFNPVRIELRQGLDALARMGAFWHKPFLIEFEEGENLCSV